LILSFEVKVVETHLLWAVYTYTKEKWAPKNPEDVTQWLQGVILREGTIGFQKKVEKWKKEIPDDMTYTYAELIVHEWWPDESEG